MAVNLPGQDYQSGHQAHFFLYSVDNPKGLVDEYNRWLDRCSSYHRSGVNPVSGIADNRDVVRHVDTTLPDGADAGLAVDGRAFYYMVRGVMVQAYTKMDGGNCAYLHSDAPRPLAPGLAALSGETILQHDRKQLRYSLTGIVAGGPANGPTTDYYSYVPVAGLLIVGHASTGHQLVLDTLFAQTLHRVEDR